MSVSDHNLSFTDLENEIRNQVLGDSSFTVIPQTELVSSPTNIEADFLQVNLGFETSKSKKTELDLFQDVFLTSQQQKQLPEMKFSRKRLNIFENITKANSRTSSLEK